ncbi:transposable element Tcb1 transposase [Trichonephila clavipes]|nr:transposable element Tcb1 transposase [Trichonephila clavipes]
MMEAGWSARRIARQLGCSDFVVRKCWDKWIREMTFTRKSSSGCPRQASRRDEVKQPARSPDLSPIKHIWDHLGWRVGHSTSLNELEATVQQIWNEMSQDIIQNLYVSIPDCIASCIRARGDSTGY